MSQAIHGAAGVIVGKRALHHMRAVLERETGPQAALLLREIGFATGETLYEAFAAWVGQYYDVSSPRELDQMHLGEALSGFLSEAGWGTAAVAHLTDSVLALDLSGWAEVDARGVDHPSCHFSSGMLADFFTRLGGTQAAVMEVECSSRGESRCRFLVGSPDVLTYLYERMSAGLTYQQAVHQPAVE